MGQSCKDPLVWQHAIELTTEIYKFTAIFPDAEKFGLTNQMRRAAVSIASNIGEGYGRATKFLGHSRGSCSELETQLGFGTTLHPESSEALCHDVSRLLSALTNSLCSKQPSP
jgi:four helix bundle protein